MARGPSTQIDPYLVASQPNVRFTSIIASGEALPTGGGLFSGIPDGIGAYDNGNGTITVLVNHELGGTVGVPRDHGGTGAYIDRLVIDKATLAIVSADDAIKQTFLWNTASDSFVQTAAVNFSRFCSADLPAATALFDVGSGLGSTARIFLTGEEAGPEGRAFATVVTGAESGNAYELAFLGNLSYENVVANPYQQVKTIVAATDDTGGGQVYLYVGDKKATGTEVDKAGLTGGELYGIKVTGLPVESSASPANGTFSLARIGDTAPGGVSEMTGAQIDAESTADGVTAFARPEDLAWDPENPNVAYFVTTNSFDQPTRLYKLTFDDVTNPVAGGKIEVVVEGNATNGAHMFDNLSVENGKVIIQEDPGNNAYLARVWEYDILTGSFTEQAKFDAAQFVSGAPGFLTQDEESSGIIDVTAYLGDQDTRAYLLDAQIHKPFPDPNLATPGNEVVEYGQLLVMYADDAAPVGTRQADFLRGNSNDQTIDANNGNDIVWAFGGNDSVAGGNGNDQLHGGVGNDRLAGANGDDVLFGDLGDDLLQGGRGSDSFVFNNSNFGNGKDVISDFGKDDRILTTAALDLVGGEVELGAGGVLELFDGGTVALGRKADVLVLLGNVTIDGTTYFSYGLDG